jgi:hypothetical protein
MAASPSALTAAPTVSELMELGVYSEETKGDVDAALLLYQQVVADVTASQTLAAQAQFRLAMCYDKKRDFAAATSAFEKLIRDYPKEKDLVSLASEYLADGAALLPAPWSDGEVVEFDLKMPTGMKVGFGRYSVNAGESDGHKTWRFGSLIVAGPTTWSQLDVDARSMRPIKSDWKNQMAGTIASTFCRGRAELKIKGAEPKTIELPGIVYDNDECLQVIRRLPLAPGYTTTISVLVGSAGMVVPVQLSSAGPEKVQVPAGSFECHKVTLTIANTTQTLWYTTDAHRYLVKFDACGVIAETTSIKQGGPAQRVSMTEPNLGYSVSAPSGWLIKNEPNPDSSRRPTLLVVDDRGVTATIVKIELQKNFTPATLASPRTFAEFQIKMGSTYPMDTTLRPDSWRETTVEGQPAVSFVCDHVKGEIKLAVLSTCALVNGTTVDISCYLPPEELEAFRPQYEALVASYRSK